MFGSSPGSDAIKRIDLQLPKFLFRKAIKLHDRLRGPRRYRYLLKSIREIKPKCILELGTWNGTRAVQMISEARKFNSAEEIAYYGFDLFEEMTERILREESSKWPPSFHEVEERLLETGVHSCSQSSDGLRTPA